MAGQLIPVRVGDVQIEVEAVPVAGSELTSSGKASRVAENALEAFGRAQDAIVEVAKSTARMIERAGAKARPDRVEVEFGIKFSASGTVIMAGVAGEGSLKVTLCYDVSARPPAAPTLDKQSPVEPTAMPLCRPRFRQRAGRRRGISVACSAVRTTQ